MAPHPATVGHMADDASRAVEIGYFSMEIAVDDAIPTYSGGLGVLAGDHLRSACDLGLPIVGVTLIYHDGFFRQSIDSDGRQVERPVEWSPEEQLERLDARVDVTIGGRRVTVGVWRKVLTGASGCQVPLYFLDTRQPDNDPSDQSITDQLYIGDPAVRLSQEVVLGLAGPEMLSALGHDIATFHMNEGHASLVPVSLLSKAVGGAIGTAASATIEDVRTRCVFTTHTPVPAGHDRFNRAVVRKILGTEMTEGLGALGCMERGQLNMTVLGMFFSGFVNGVARRHAAVSQAMFPQFRVVSVTNGVHMGTWAAPSTQRLFDRHFPLWREDNGLLRYAVTIPLEEVNAAHVEAKDSVLGEITRRSGRVLDPEALTVGVARRAAAYKRNDLLLSDTVRLKELVDEIGPLQVVFSGKAHPLDVQAKDIIAHIHDRAKILKKLVTVVYLEDYGMELAKLLCAGVDLWLNTPVAPFEASGTSGMKAAINGVPSLSVMDGWWLEGHIEGVTGWAIGGDPGAGRRVPVGNPEVDAADATELYRVLHDVVAPMFYKDPDAFTAVRQGAMAFNGSFFTTQRMVSEYAAAAYRPSTAAGTRDKPTAILPVQPDLSHR